jgi:hypothetical protein
MCRRDIVYTFAKGVGVLIVCQDCNDGLWQAMTTMPRSVKIELVDYLGSLSK